MSNFLMIQHLTKKNLFAHHFAGTKCDGFRDFFLLNTLLFTIFFMIFKFVFPCAEHQNVGDIKLAQSVPTQFPTTESAIHQNHSSFNPLTSSPSHIQESKTLKIENLGFIHIGKNAGTSMETLGQELHLGWGKYLYGTRGWKKIKTINDDGSCQSKYHMPPRYFNKSVYFLDYNFCVIRNPLSRLVSEFKFSQKHPNGNSYYGFKPFNRHFTYDNIGLNEWVIVALTLYQTKKFIHDCHLIPAYEFIFDDHGTRTCQAVLQFENLSEDFEKLKAIFHFEAELIHKYQSQVTTVTVDDLNETSLIMIRKVYHDDLALLKDINFKFFDVN